MQISAYAANQLVFADESAYDKRNLSRRFGWSIIGSRARQATFFVRDRRFTIKGALCIDGLLAYRIQEGPMDSKDFEFFIENILVWLLINNNKISYVIFVILLKFMYIFIVAKNESVSWTL